MARVNPDNPDIARTSALCPATSLPGQTGHIPLGMSGCPVSGFREVEREGEKTPRRSAHTDNGTVWRSIMPDRQPGRRDPERMVRFAGRVGVDNGYRLLFRSANLLPCASHSHNVVTRPLRWQGFQQIARCCHVIGCAIAADVPGETGTPAKGRAPVAWDRARSMGGVGGGGRQSGVRRSTRRIRSGSRRSSKIFAAASKNISVYK